jgi:hypothetical protein
MIDFVILRAVALRVECPAQNGASFNLKVPCLLYFYSILDMKPIIEDKLIPERSRDNDNRRTCTYLS